MGFPQALLALAGAAGLAALILLVLGSIYFEATNSELPAGLERPARLRLIHACRIGAAVLGRILENLRLCTQIQFVRFVRNAWTRRRDPALCVQDFAFEGIPVRIYRPKAPSAAGPRKGIVYFHGGGWIFGSLDPESSEETAQENGPPALQGHIPNKSWVKLPNNVAMIFLH